MANILICDDEPNILEVIGDILSDEGHTVFKSETGIKGLSVIQDEDIDIAIVDVLMPLLSGNDVLVKIKKNNPEIQVIMISGHANIDMAVTAMKHGAFDFLEKPPSLSKLLNVVNRALKLKKKKRK